MEVAFPDEVITPVRFAFVVAVIELLHVNPVPEVQFSAFVAATHDGTAMSDGVVAVRAPNNVLAVWFASAAVTVPLAVTALDGVLDSTVPSPVKVTLVTVPALELVVPQENPVPLV